jgi:hypothetical protein
MVAATALRLGAHDDYRIIGAVVKASATVLEMKNKDGKKFAINLNKQTAVMREGKKLGASALKPGMNLVVDASGDSEADLLAIEIRIVAGK